MKVVSSPEEMKNLSQTLQKSGRTVGLVPTMGALHQGHLSLVDIANQRCDVTVMSIFVNPTQFGPNEDYANYPRTIEQDCQKAQAAGCAIVFAPSPQQIYPSNYSTYVDVHNLGERLCGKSRPGHFRGVTTVVLKLFNIVNPQVAVFGQKDAQQVVVLQQMARDLNLSVHIEAGPVVRERDGLALSSRNIYLTGAERAEAPLICKGLNAAHKAFVGGERDVAVLRSKIAQIYNRAHHFQVEYVEMVDAITLEPLKVIEKVAIAAVACRTKQSATRLIDNVIMGGTL